jgi:hypothetical protein
VVPVERRARRQRARYREVRVDCRDVRDRGLLEIEYCRILSAVRDLEHGGIEKKRLIALAAELGGASADSEQLGRDPRGLFRRETRRRRLENSAGGRHNSKYP